MDLLKRAFRSEIKGIDEEERSITAYISTKARDRMDESLDPAGVDLSKYKKNPVVLWAHDYEKPPIGRAMWTKADDKGILSKVQFADTPFAKEIFGLYKDGFMKAFSVGFLPKKWDDGDGKKTASRTYTDWEMLEYSAVPVPANPEALTLMMKKGIIDKTAQNNEDLTEKAQKAEQYDCECIDCGKKLTTSSHCKDIKCSECGGTMRRADRPGPGQEGIKEEEQKETEFMPDSDKLLKRYEHEKEVLTEVNEALTKENSDLRKHIYSMYVALNSNEPSEITVDELVKEINEVTNGVIRQMQGKI